MDFRTAEEFCLGGLLAGTVAAIAGFARHNSFRTYLAVPIWQACYRSQACQANIHLDLGCTGQEPPRSGPAGPGPAFFREFCVAWNGT